MSPSFPCYWKYCSLAAAGALWNGPWSNTRTLTRKVQMRCVLSDIHETTMVEKRAPFTNKWKRKNRHVLVRCHSEWHSTVMIYVRQVISLSLPKGHAGGLMLGYRYCWRVSRSVVVDYVNCTDGECASCSFAPRTTPVEYVGVTRPNEQVTSVLYSVVTLVSICQAVLCDIRYY